MPKKIAVIDGNSLMHRAYHAVPATMNAPTMSCTVSVRSLICADVSVTGSLPAAAWVAACAVGVRASSRRGSVSSG